MDKGLQLWKKWFEWDGSPWVYDDRGGYCFFCIEDEPEHAEDCIFVKAKALIKETENETKI